MHVIRLKFRIPTNLNVCRNTFGHYPINSRSCLCWSIRPATHARIPWAESLADLEELNLLAIAGHVDMAEKVFGHWEGKSSTWGPSRRTGG